MQLKQSLKLSSYTTSTHIVQKSSPPNLFKINKVSHDEKLSNLCILLNGQSTSFQVLPKNEDALKIIRHNAPLDEKEVQVEKKNVVEIGQIRVTLWKEGVHDVWYVGYCIGIPPPPHV